MTAARAPREGVPMEVGTTYHMHFDVRGGLRWKKSRLRGMLRDADGKRLLTPDEARDVLMDALSRGIECIPIGECDNFDPKEGCRGHRPSALPSDTEGR